jgi:hypothetical protein
MRHSDHFRLYALVALIGLILLSLNASAQQSSASRGRKFKMPPPTGRVEITVVRDSSGKPIVNAAVIFHEVGDKGNMELKSNDDGKAVIDVLPIGSTVRLQVIAKGFQTYGDDFKVDKDTIAIEVRMKRPGEQYSIYRDHPEGTQGGNSSDTAKPADHPKAQPNQPQPK